MTLQTDLETAVSQAQADSDKLKDIVNGPVSGDGSMVTVDSGDVKSVARAIAEIGDVSNQALKDLSNVADADFVTKAASAGVGAGDLIAANNLSELTDMATARGNLGLGSAAVETVAAGGSAGVLRADGDGSQLTGVSANITALEASMALAQMDIATNGDLAAGVIVDGMRDTFADETGIDTDNSAYSYNSSGKYVTPPTPSRLIGGEMWQNATENCTLGEGTISGMATDKNISTNERILQGDFDVTFTMGDDTTSASAGVVFGCLPIPGATSGTGEQPSYTDPVFAVNGMYGYQHGNTAEQVARTSGFLNDALIRFTRSGSDYSVFIDGVLDYTYSGTVGNTDLDCYLYFGTRGAQAGWFVTDLKYTATYDDYLYDAEGETSAGVAGGTLANEAAAWNHLTNQTTTNSASFSPDGTDFAFGKDHGVGNEQSFVRMVVTSPDTRGIWGGVAGEVTLGLEGSDNGTDWADLGGATTKMWDTNAGGQTQHIFPTDLTAYRYHRARFIKVSGGAGYINPAQIEWFTATGVNHTNNVIPKMTGYTTPSGTVSASNEYPLTAYEAWHSFDMDATTDWQTQGIMPSNQWLEYEFSTAKTITKYGIAIRGTGGISPKDWTFEGYNGSSWDVLDTRAGYTWQYDGMYREWPISNTTPYTRYRIHATTANSTELGLRQLSMMETATYGGPQTLISTTFNADAAPDTATFYGLWKDVDAATWGTNATLEATRDGGTTWTAGTYSTVLADAGGAGVDLVKAVVDLSAQPSGTSMAYRFKTLDETEQNLYAATLGWS
jgi:hypothetical protein